MKLEIIGLTGKKFHGKDTAANIIAKYSTSNVIRLSFAQPIKQALSFIHVIPMDYFNDPDLKEKPLPDWNGRTPRELAQWLGTDIYRNMFDRNIWIKNMELRIKKYLNSEMDTLILITDVRFEDEAEFVKNIGGNIWKIDRSQIIPISSDFHESEDGISDNMVDIFFDNNRDIGFLEEQIKSFI